MPKIIVVESCVECLLENMCEMYRDSENGIPKTCDLKDASDLVSREAVMEIYEEWHNTRKTCAEDDADAGNKLGIKLGNLIKSMPSAFAEKGEK